MGRRRKKNFKIIAGGRGGNSLLEKLSGKPAPRYEFRLYIAGTNLSSIRAIQHLRELCERLRPAICDFEIIDLYQQPELAKRDEIVAAPVLIKFIPPPCRSFIGDLSDVARVMAGLGITKRTEDVRNESEGQREGPG